MAGQMGRYSNLVQAADGILLHSVCLIFRMKNQGKKQHWYFNGQNTQNSEH